MRNTLLCIVVLGSAFVVGGCSSTTNNPGNSDVGGTPGSGTSATGGGSVVGSSAGGNAPGNGGASTSSNGGSSVTSSSTSAGGTTGSTTVGNSGGTSTTSATGSGGTSTSSTAKGGTTSTSAGGSVAGGGKSSTGGASAGGKAGVGGAAAGGTSAASVGGTSAVGVGGASGSGNTSSTGITVKLDSTKQEMAGFGINNNWAPAMTDKEADELFDVTKGIGLTILRIGMGSDGGHYNTASPGDITKAKARGAKFIIGSTWSPPKECKSNNNENDGGHLLESCFTSWSDKLAKFSKDNGLYAMSIGNEPDFASCGSVEPCNGNYPTTVYTANEMVKFIKVAGPKIQAAGTKVIAPEASEWIHNWSNESAKGSEPGNKNSSDPLKCGFPPSNAACDKGDGYDYGHYLYKDKDAWKALDIMGVHQYDTQVAEPWPADVPEKKPVWQTEMSGVKWWPEQGPSSDIKNGVAVAEWIHSAVTVGEAAAWLWWWYKANNTDDNEGLYLKNGTDTKRHYTLGNYSKFIRPGYMRVDVGGTAPTGVLLSAYKSTDGTVVIVAINKGTAAVSAPIAISGGTAPASCTPNVTSSSDNLKAGTAVTVTGGTLTAALAATTVTTFVCK